MLTIIPPVTHAAPESASNAGERIASVALPAPDSARLEGSLSATTTETSAEASTCAAPSNRYQTLKRALDVIVASLLLVLLAPWIVIAAGLIKLTSRGPAFYRQVRVGQAGRHFTLIKLRTMRQNAEAESGPIWSPRFDSRVTPFGQLLRQLHIDEFPQVWNVIVGDMSLVGPRPERPEFVAQLEAQVPCYRDRLLVRPGITGLAQLRQPPDSSLESVCRKVEHDVYYIQHIGLWLDFKLLCGTAFHLALELSQCLQCLFRLPTTVEIRQACQQLDMGERGNRPDDSRCPEV
ncbi:MAG: sugar transferase [Planctomycetes bacterium]|nr:sugar transferase [Planctomycetota bacterium]